MPEPVKLPPLEIAPFMASDCQEYIVMGQKENRLTEAQAAEVIRRIEGWEKLVTMLTRIQEHHKWVQKECVWHLEANAQVGLLRLLKDLDETLALSSKGD